MTDAPKRAYPAETHSKAKLPCGADLSTPGGSLVAYPGRAQNVAIRFDQFTLLPAERRLQKSGEDVRLGGRTFDILAALIERAPGLVSKRELLDRVWPGLTVEEGNLRFQITSLRKALGDDQGVARYVSTVQGRGYCFVANVSRTLHVGEGSAPDHESRSDDEARTNLPLPMHPIIDRESELAELEDSLQHHRLVTLVGTGGVGKTRLAIELGRRTLPRYPDGVWLVDLAPLSDPALIASATAAALDLLGNGEPTAEDIAELIAKRKLLLIFDNCEHLVDAVAELGDSLLSRVGGLTVLATSQESLRVAEEQIFRLEPLSLAPVGATDVAKYGAAALFVELVGRADRRFALTAENARSVTEICRQLDGVPLALEMAAARLPLLGLEGLRSGLAERLSMLKGAPRRSDLRHRTLRHVVAWSYDLLDEIDQAVFCRLAVFPSSFSLDAAVAVMAPFGIDRWGTLDAIWRLREKSLVAVEHDAAPRYRLLETLRIFAAERLAERGETDVAAGAHANYFTGLMSRAYAAWLSDLRDGWERICLPELDNVRAASEWALRAPGRALVAMELISVSGILAYRHGSDELKRYVGAAVALLDSETPSAIAARLWRLSSACFDDDNQAAYRDRAERAVALARVAGDKMELGLSLVDRPYAGIRRGAYQEAMTALEEATQIAAETSSPRVRLRTLYPGSVLARARGDLLEGRRMLLVALEISRTAEDGMAEQNTLLHLAEYECALGNYQQAVELATQGLEAEGKGRRPYLGAKWLRMNLASYLCLQGDIAAARETAFEALSEGQGGNATLRVCLQHWALLGALEGRFKHAAELNGFIEVSLAASGEVFETTEQQLDTRLREILDANLSCSEIRDCMAKGAGWSEAEALDFASRHLIRDGG
jgi:predicted ATPase/DNA-binding winged helix-turn-helix (wHTH) protein